MMIEAVVFDVDGVLVRSGIFGAQLREHGLERAALDSFWRGPFVQCSLGLSDLKEELGPLLGESGYKGSVEDFLRAWFEADSALNAKAFDEVKRLRSRGVPCHVASNQERYRAAYLEGPMGLAEHFDSLFFSCRLGVKKPELEFFRQVTRELGAASGHLLFFDDQQANVEAARAAGWNAELYALGDDLPSLLAGHGVVI
jgi:putative hydrolase of the HAD superfamily